MKEYKFKTDIKCSGCVAKVSPYLDSLSGLNKWEVDISHPEKILTVSTEGANARQLKELLIHAGFKAEEIK